MPERDPRRDPRPGDAVEVDGVLIIFPPPGTPLYKRPDRRETLAGWQRRAANAKVIYRAD